MSDVISEPGTIKGIGLSSAASLSYKLFEDITLNFGIMSMDLPGISDSLTGEMKTFQIMASYKILFGDQFWNGVSISSGIIKNSLKLKLHVDIDESASEGIITAHLNGGADVNIDSSVTTIPLFATTGITVFNFFNFYCSVGGNFAKGDSTVKAELLADVTYDNANSTSEAHYGLNGSFSEGFSFKPTLLLGTNLLIASHFSFGLQYAKMSEDSSLGLNISFPF